MKAPNGMASTSLGHQGLLDEDARQHCPCQRQTGNPADRVCQHLLTRGVV